jgi:hypothetical protein
MPTIRPVRSITASQPTIEGAGVHLKRAFGFSQENLFDPFLLLDDFRSDDPELYLKGFPWHPHRGIETITYVLKGEVEHGDSLGNQGVISSGDVQWMTAGSGIIHQEMPKGAADGAMYGFQLWANLPAAQKMMAPRYRDVKDADIPVIHRPDGAAIRLISGQIDGVRGPVGDIVIDPQYLDVSLPAHSRFNLPIPAGYTALAYFILGAGCVSSSPETWAENTSLVLYADGDSVEITTAEQDTRFLLISGKPLEEPVAWYGPIVMNTQAELQQAYQELRQGTFIKPS